MNIQLGHNQSQFSHIIELKQTYNTLNIGFVRIAHMRNIEQINGEASLSTLVEELASHDKRNHLETY
jgi:hypothetical protein